MGGLTARHRPRPRAQLPPALAAALGEILALARQHRQRVYLVGGTARDLLLGRTPLDLDLMVDDGAVILATRFAAATRARLAVHKRFATAVVHLPGGWRVDVASPRRERYSREAALPAVAPAAVWEDLRRRDFTINAMAWQWGSTGPGRLLDPTGGREDLRARCIRILHPASFEDDPTRAFRAVRLACRLGFRLEPRTARALTEAVGRGRLDLLSPARRGREIRLLAEERHWPRAVSRAARLGLLGTGPARLVPAPPPACRRLQRSLTTRAMAREPLPPILACLAMDGGSAALAGLQLPGGMARRAGAILTAAQQLRRLVENLRRPPGMGELARWAWDMDEEAILLTQACLATAAGRRAVARFRRRRRGTRLRIRAAELLAAGVPRGPELRRRLTATRRQRLAGDLKSRAAELAFALSPSALSFPGG